MMAVVERQKKKKKKKKKTLFRRRSTQNITIRFGVSERTQTGKSG